MIQYTHIDLLRHGALETSGVFCANPEEPLSAKGQQNLLDATKNGMWDLIISSPHQRCHSFAKILASQKACTLLIEPAFQEMDFGQWTGVPTKKLWAQEPQLLKQLWEAPETFIAPKGESMQAFTQRVQNSWQATLKKHQYKKILLLTHAGVIRAILTEALNISHQSALTFNIEYAHLTQLHYYADGIYSLRSHGKQEI